jgi:hypothetical protein
MGAQDPDHFLKNQQPQVFDEIGERDFKLGPHLVKDFLIGKSVNAQEQFTVFTEVKKFFPVILFEIIEKKHRIGFEEQQILVDILIDLLLLDFDLEKPRVPEQDLVFHRGDSLVGQGINE